MPYKLSPSSLNLMEECQRCFWLQLNSGISRPGGIFPSLPSGMDRVLKAYFDSFRDRKALPPELHSINAKLFSNTELLDVWRNNRKGIQFNDEAGNIVRGAVDDILQKGSKLIVLDFKTRGFPVKDDTASHSQLQLDVYNFLLRKAGYETEDYAYLLFYMPKEVGKAGEFIFNSELVKMDTSIKNAERAISKALTILKGKLPGINNDCEFCKWTGVEGVG